MNSKYPQVPLDGLTLGPLLVGLAPGAAKYAEAGEGPRGGQFRKKITGSRRKDESFQRISPYHALLSTPSEIARSLVDMLLGTFPRDFSGRGFNSQGGQKSQIFCS